MSRIVKRGVRSDVVLLLMAVVFLVLSLAVFVFTSSLFEDLPYRSIGLAASNGTVNISVVTNTAINFTSATISWGSGQVTNSSSVAILDTAPGTVTNGSWVSIASGFVIENIGNINVTLDIQAAKNATDFLGGANPLYRYNVTEIESGSCLNASGGSGALQLTSYLDMNTTTPGTRVCGRFQYLDSFDSVSVDIHLRIPSDSLTGSLSDTMTATAAAA